MSTGEQHLTIKQTAERFKVTDRTVRKWLATGVLRCIRIGRNVVRIPMDAIQAMENTNGKQ